MEFFKRVRQVYLDRARNEPNRIQIIDATQSLPVIQAELKKCLTSIINNRRGA